MALRNRVRRHVGTLLRKTPRLREMAVRGENALERMRWSAAKTVPALIRPDPYMAMIAITAKCNARCIGCRYGRDFMNGHELSFTMIRDALDDMRAAGIYKVRLYGGEPLLHRDLPKIVEHCRKIGITPIVTTNAVLLPEKIEELYAAGLRDVTVGFYGTGNPGDAYMQRKGYGDRVEAGLRAARELAGPDLDMQLNWLLMRPSCNLPALHRAFGLAQDLRMQMQVDLIHYSLPYFTEGPDRELQFKPEDEGAIREIADELLRLRQIDPQVIRLDPTYIRSIPDWLLAGPSMRVPCTVQRLVWIGADGTVQLCYVTFKLGNLHEKPLRELLFTKTHHEAARSAFQLDCPNCHCEAGERTLRHAETRRRYTV